MNINLKNCPFCGGDASLTHKELSYDHPNGSVVKCKNCGARGEWFPVDAAYSSDEKAIAAWNNRIDSLIYLKGEENGREGTEEVR